MASRAAYHRQRIPKMRHLNLLAEVASLLAGGSWPASAAGPIDGGSDGAGSSWVVIRVSGHSVCELVTGGPANIELAILKDLR